MQEVIGRDIFSSHIKSGMQADCASRFDLPDFIAKEGLPVIIMYIAHLIMGFVGVAL